MNCTCTTAAAKPPAVSAMITKPPGILLPLKKRQHLYYSTNVAVVQLLARYNINTGKVRENEDKWDITGFSLSHHEKCHTITVNEDGRNKVLLFDHANVKAR